MNLFFKFYNNTKMNEKFMNQRKRMSPLPGPKTVATLIG